MQKIALLHEYRTAYKHRKHIFHATMSAILFSHLCLIFVGTPSNIDEYTLKRLCAKNGAFVRLVTIILLSHLTTSSINRFDRLVDWIKTAGQLDDWNCSQCLCGIKHIRTYIHLENCTNCQIVYMVAFTSS